MKNTKSICTIVNVHFIDRTEAAFVGSGIFASSLLQAILSQHQVMVAEPLFPVDWQLLSQLAVTS